MWINQQAILTDIIFQEYFRISYNFISLNQSGISTCAKLASSLKAQITFINLNWPQDVKFSQVIIYVEIPWILIFDLGIYKECHNFFSEIPGLKVCFLWNCESKVINLKAPVVFFRSVYPQPLCSGIDHSDVRSQLHKTGDNDGTRKK